MRVFVTGGTGYVGQPMVRLLLERGHDVTALVRAGSHRTLDNHPNMTCIEGDVLSLSDVSTGMVQADAVIHLVGIIREKPSLGVTMQRLHTEATRNVVEAASHLRIKRLLHMSALGVRHGAQSTYHQSKWAAEQIVQTSGIPYTIFRPSVVFGPGGPGPSFVRQLADIIQRAPIHPVLGNGMAKLQPVSVQTVAEAFCAALDNPKAINRVYDLGGPHVISYIDILRAIAFDQRKQLIPVHVPLRLMFPLARVFQNWSAFPITLDQLTMLREGNVCSDSETAYRELGLRPIPFTADKA